MILKTKLSYEVMLVDDRYTVVSGHDTILKGDKFVTRGRVGIRNVETFNESIGFTGHAGHSFLWFSEGLHFKFIKFITKSDIRKFQLPLKDMVVKRTRPKRYKINNWSNPGGIHGK